MPFDPEFRFKAQLVHPDDAPLLPGGEIDLPADLAALAEQLGEDAAHLAARYPADRAPAVALSAELIESAARLKRRSRSRVVWMAGASLASAVLVALTVGIVLQNRQSPQQNRHSVAVSPPAAISPGAAEAAELSVLPGPHPAAGTLSVGELSGPEMEALLDLLNGEPKSVASISF